MINLTRSIPEVRQSISRPIVFDVIGQLKKYIFIDDDVNIYFPGPDGYTHTVGSNEEHKQEYAPRLGSESKLLVTVTEGHNEDELSLTEFDPNKRMSIFVDPHLGIHILPVYAKMDVVVEFTYRSSSESEVQQWADMVRMYVSKLNQRYQHDITYHYEFLDEYLCILGKIHEYRERQGGYGESFSEYFLKNSSERVTLTSGTDGQEPKLSVSETQYPVVGYFDFSGIPPKLQADNSNGVFSVSFSYNFTYDRVHGLHIRYPIIVHNQPLPEDLIRKGKKVNSITTERIRTSTMTKAQMQMSTFSFTSMLNNKTNLIRLPDYDHFIPDGYLRGTGGYAHLLMQVSPEDPYTLFNLKDMGDYELDTDVLNFMLESEYPYLGEFYASILGIQVYKDSALLGNKTVTCDKDGNLKTTVPMDIRKEYRVRLYCVADQNLLMPEAKERLKNYPEALIKIIQTINDGISYIPELNGSHGGSTRKPYEYTYLYELINRGGDGSGGGVSWPDTLHREKNGKDTHTGGNTWPYKKNPTNPDGSPNPWDIPKDVLDHIRDVGKIYALTMNSGLRAARKNIVKEIVEKGF